MSKRPELYEIENQILAALDNPDSYSGMTYQEGVVAALEWVIGQSSTPPMDDED